MAHGSAMRQIYGAKNASKPNAPRNPWFAKTSNSSPSSNPPEEDIVLRNPNRIDGRRQLAHPEVSINWANSIPSHQQSIPYQKMETHLNQRNPLEGRTVHRWRKGGLRSLRPRGLPFFIESTYQCVVVSEFPNSSILRPTRSVASNRVVLEKLTPIDDTGNAMQIEY